MALSLITDKSVPLLIAICAIGALLSKKPSISAIFLFVESLLVSVNLWMTGGTKSSLIATSLVLNFFAMIVVGNNLYLEISHKTPPTKSSKFNIVIGIAFLFIFWSHIDRISPTKFLENGKGPPPFLEDGLTIVIFGFALFVILVSALTILDIKISNREGRHDF